MIFDFNGDVLGGEDGASPVGTSFPPGLAANGLPFVVPPSPQPPYATPPQPIETVEISAVGGCGRVVSIGVTIDDCG
jgi:hypothetical protein